MFATPYAEHALYLKSWKCDWLMLYNVPSNETVVKTANAL
jgi:hypothetical protein